MTWPAIRNGSLNGQRSVRISSASTVEPRIKNTARSQGRSAPPRLELGAQQHSERPRHDHGDRRRIARRRRRAAGGEVSEALRVAQVLAVELGFPIAPIDAETR